MNSRESIWFYARKANNRSNLSFTAADGKIISKETNMVFLDLERAYD